MCENNFQNTFYNENLIQNNRCLPNQCKRSREMTDFSDFQNNCSSTPVSFGPLKPQPIAGTPSNPVYAETGVFHLPNGDVSFRFHYLGASEASVEIHRGWHHKKIALEKDGDGFFVGAMTFGGDPNWVGLLGFSLKVDGIETICSRIPIISNASGTQNYIFIPDENWDNHLPKRVRVPYRLKEKFKRAPFLEMSPDLWAQGISV
jgi:hypothetical protein